MGIEDIHRPFSDLRPATRWLMIISTLCFVLQHIWGEWMVDHLALVPAILIQNHFYWQPLTYPLLHAGLFPWLFNLFILWMIGNMLENQWGTPFFLRFYFISTVGAALPVILFAAHSLTPLVGLSTAIFAMLVAFAMVNPDSVIYLYFLIPLKAWHAAVLFAFIEFFAALNGRNAGMISIANLSAMAFAYLYIRFGTQADFRLGALFERKPKVTLHEVTDDLVDEVDRILEKVSRKGADSLTAKEKEIMGRYTKTRR